MVLSLIGGLILAVSGLTMFLDAVLAQPLASDALMSSRWRTRLVQSIGGDILPDGIAQLPLERIFLASIAICLCAWFAGASLLSLSGRFGWKDAIVRWGRAGSLWGIACGTWWVGWLVLRLLGHATAVELLESQTSLFVAVIAAGVIATFVTIASSTRRPTPPESNDAGQSSERPSRWAVTGVFAAMFLYTAVYFTLNTRLYQNLLIPHGDTAMYEEHLWNLEHGKGFRSYLDPGLFLGEHIQVVHILLVPLHLLWPSHLLLELCQSAVLAAVAWPVFCIARRHTGSDRVGLLLALAALCYTPMQYLDISIDIKTFRPTAFGIAPLLLAIDAMERLRIRQMLLWMLLALSCQEDFAIPIGCLGAWLAATSAIEFWRRRRPTANETTGVPSAARKGVIAGTVVLVVAVIYLLVVVKWVIPWFRGQETVHYATYFPKFGESPTEIVWNMLTRPGLLFSELFTPGMVAYSLHLLVPLGLMSLFAPGRLLVGLPLWVLLCLNEMAHKPYYPVHHFHAPLIPILLWSAIVGVENVAKVWGRLCGPTLQSHPEPASAARRISMIASTFALGCSIGCGLFNSVGPQSLQFWDPGRMFHWHNLYVITERARLFDRVLEQIPPSARVASTDFVHPRFTHHERSYDYSHYQRAVAGGTTNVPVDTDYIVIDTGHRYSWIHSADEVRELQEEPNRWELLPIETKGYFIVLRRRDAESME